MNVTGFDPRLASEPYPSTPGFWPIASAARYVGMSARLLVSGIERGEIPVTLRRVGPGRKQFVNAEQLKAWVNAPAREENLFEESAK